MKKIFILFFVLIALVNCSLWKKIETLWHHEWTGYVYPDRSDLTKSRFIGTFDSKEGCLSAIRSAMGPNGDGECGLNCDDSGICLETAN